MIYFSAGVLGQKSLKNIKLFRNEKKNNKCR